MKAKLKKSYYNRGNLISNGYFIAFALISLGLAGYNYLPRVTEIRYRSIPEVSSAAAETQNILNTDTPALSPSRIETPLIVVTHIATPEPVKGVYMTACIAGNKKYRNKILDLIDKTEL